MGHSSGHRRTQTARGKLKAKAKTSWLLKLRVTGQVMMAAPKQTLLLVLGTLIMTCLSHYAASLTVRSCEGSQLNIECKHGGLIRIQKAFYGRLDANVCVKDTKVGCVSPQSKHIIVGTCDGQTKCSIEVSNSVFGDPCQGTYKYAEVEYECEQADKYGP